MTADSEGSDRMKNVHDYDLARELLTRVAVTDRNYADPFVTAFAITGAAVSTLGDFLGSETVSATDRQAARLDEVQFDLGEGPCWDAMTTARPILEPKLRQQPVHTWPGFTEAIRSDRIGSIFAFPLFVGPLHFGAVDLYSIEPTELDGVQIRQAGSLAGVVGRRVLRRALAASGEEYDEADANPYSRRRLHQATGMVLAQLVSRPKTRAW